MTPNQIRDAVRTLQAQGQSLRQISRGLQLSRNTVRRILRTPAPAAAQEAERQRLGITLATLQSAFARAQGNVVRMGQLLTTEYDCQLSYSTLTRWVREAGLRAPPPRATPSPRCGCRASCWTRRRWPPASRRSRGRRGCARS